MRGFKIRLLEFNHDRAIESTVNPTWDKIENAVRSLTTKPNRIDLYGDKSDGTCIMVSGSPGAYALDVIIDDSNAAMLVSKSKVDETPVEVFGEEYRADQVVHDIAIVVRLVKELVDSSRFVDTDDMKWEFRRM